MATMKTMNLLPGFNEDFPKDPLDLGKIFDTERKIFYVRSEFYNLFELTSWSAWYTFYQASNG